MSSARGRTMAHMHHMLAATTAALGCSRATDSQTVTIQPLPTVPLTASSPAPPPPPTASPTASVAPTPTPVPTPSGYLVVDMLPAPARCMGLAASSHASAKVHKTAKGFVVDLTVKLGPHATFDGTANAWSGSVASSSYTSHSTVATLRLDVAPGSGTLGVTFGVSCGAAGSGMLAVNATFVTMPPVDGSSPALSMQDY